jgi:hypothetical protein
MASNESSNASNDSPYLKYIKSSQYEPITGSNPHHDGYELAVDGIIFSRHRKNKASTNWLCKHPGCAASITLDFSDRVDRQKA